MSLLRMNKMTFFLLVEHDITSDQLGVRDVEITPEWGGESNIADMVTSVSCSSVNFETQGIHDRASAEEKNRYHLTECPQVKN